MAKKKTQAELMAAKGYLSLNAAADRLGVQRQTVWRWAEEGKVKHVRVVRQVYVEEKSLILHVGSEASALLRVGNERG